MTAEVKDIHTAITAIMAQVGYVQKERKGGLAYSFAGEAALIAALRPWMVEQQVYAYVFAVLNKKVEHYETSKGTAMTSTTLDGVIRFVHAPSGTFIDSFATGEGADAGDKSSNKALTGAYKYALRQTFCIETGDDPDNFEGQQRKTAKAGGNGKPTMTYDEARLVTNSKGEPYGALSPETLSNMSREINKKLKSDVELDPERRANYEHKLEAIKVLLAAGQSE